MFVTILSNDAAKQIKKLPPRYRRSALEALEDLKENPRLGKPLTRELKGRYSFWFGPYRIIYKISQKEKRVEILAVKHRKVAYI